MPHEVDLDPDRFVAPAAGRPAIFHNARQLDEVLAEAINALIAANTPPVLFIRGGELARVRDDEERRPVVESLRAEHVRNHLADAATWWKSGRESNTASFPPLEVAAAVRAYGNWALPGLVGIVELPVVRHDGTFHVKHGYDPATRLFHWHRGEPYAPIPEHPTAADVAAAKALIDDMLCDFPFDATADRANAWALLLTPIVRPLVVLVPLALLDAPQPASGKTLLATTLSILATGRQAPMQPFAPTDEELEKRITARLASGGTIVMFDNVEDSLRSHVLASALTAETWTNRVLGRTEEISVPNRATWLATGNNVKVGGDLGRRCYRIRLEPSGSAEGRSFTHSPYTPWLMSNRTRIVGALCTLVRSWMVAGRPSAPSPARLDSFDEWASVMSAILHHAGVDGFLANQAKFRATSDDEATAWENFLGAWMEHYGPDRIVTVGTLIAEMEVIDSPLRPLLPDELAPHWDTRGFRTRFGRALARRAGRRFGADGLQVVEMPKDRTRQARYCVSSDPTPHSQLDLGNISARGDSATRTDATSAEIAEITPTPGGWEGSSTGNLWENEHVSLQRGESSPQSPHLRAGEDIEW